MFLTKSKSLFSNVNLGVQNNFKIQAYECFRGKQPHQYLLSKQVKTLVDTQVIQEAKNSNLQVNQQDSSNLKSYEKTEDFELSQKEYLKIRQSNPNGQINQFQYKNLNFTLIGTQYDRLPAENIYKLLMKAQPDLIMVQIPPDYILNNVQYLNGTNQKFSSFQYVSQLIRKSSEMSPSRYLRNKIENDLIKVFSFLKPLEPLKIKYKPLDFNHFIDQQTLGVISYYGEQHQDMPILISELPIELQRIKIANTLTLMQLQQIFVESVKYLAQNPDLTPRITFEAAKYLYPQYFQSINDKYMSTIIEYLCKKKIYQNITAFVDTASAQSIVEYLENRSVSHLSIELEEPQFFETILRPLSCEELIEKHCILDVMQYGINQQEIKETLNIIKKYGDPQNINSSRIKELISLSQQLYLKYCQFYQNYYQEGEEIRRDKMIIDSKLI